MKNVFFAVLAVLLYFAATLKNLVLYVVYAPKGRK